MTAPLVRTWLAARLVDWVDHSHDVVNGIAHVVFNTVRLNEVWDDYIRRHGDLPAAPVGGDTPGQGTAGLGTPASALNRVLPCRTCKAHSNAPCINRYGEIITGCHKTRRDDVAAAAVLGGE